MTTQITATQITALTLAEARELGKEFGIPVRHPETKKPRNLAQWKEAIGAAVVAAQAKAPITEANDDLAFMISAEEVTANAQVDERPVVAATPKAEKPVKRRQRSSAAVATPNLSGRNEWAAYHQRPNMKEPAEALAFMTNVMTLVETSNKTMKEVAVQISLGYNLTRTYAKVGRVLADNERLRLQFLQGAITVGAIWKAINAKKVEALDA